MDKKSFVTRLFDDIAPTYDRINHLLSLNVDRSWRRCAIAEAARVHPGLALDVACGTGDFSMQIARQTGAAVVGADISAEMLKIGREKIAAAGLAATAGDEVFRAGGEPGRIVLEEGDCENLSFGDDTFDVVCCAFGVRNFQHVEAGLREMRRVVRPGGRIVILELSVPSGRFLRWLYKGYFMHILPRIGGMISGNYEAYAYLPRSVMNFPAPPVFMEMLRAAGFGRVSHKALTFGLARVYCGDKPLR